MKIAINKQELKAVLALSKSASSDETRFHLTHIHLIKNESGQIKAEATDGHQLCQFIFDDNSSLNEIFNDLGANELLISKSQVKILDAMLKSSSKNESLVILDNVESLFIKASYFTYGKFPNTAPFFNSTSGAVEKIGLSLNILSIVQSVLKPFSKNGNVKFSFKDELASVHLQADNLLNLNARFEAVVMPCRL